MTNLINRRQLLQAALSGAASGRFLLAENGSRSPRFKAVAFDGFTIFDPRPAFAKVAREFPEKGAEIAEAWRTRQFEYSWLRVTAHDYVDFWRVTEDALVYATKKAKVEMSASTRDDLMQTYLELPVWPEVRSALSQMRNAGLKLALLSNFSPNMLRSCAHANELEESFDALLSTDAVKSYKPDPKAYELGLKAFHLKRTEILFAPFAAWDAFGAKEYGYPTFWVNRQNQQAEELGTTADGVGSSLVDLAQFAI